MLHPPPHCLTHEIPFSRCRPASHLRIDVGKIEAGATRHLSSLAPSHQSQHSNGGVGIQVRGKMEGDGGAEVQVMEPSRRVQGQEHPDTPTSMANLALTYRNQGRWKEAEKLSVQVVETSRSRRVLGQEHLAALFNATLKQNLIL